MKPRQQMVTTLRQQYSGPLPQPADLEKYDKIVPGAAERIMQMAEKEQSHRHEKERTETATKAKLSVRGQWIGMFLALVFAAISISMAVNGFEVLATAFSAPLIIWVCSIFVIRKIPKVK